MSKQTFTFSGKTKGQGQVRDLNKQLKERYDATAERSEAYYESSQKGDDLLDAEDDKKRKNEVGCVPGLCRDCNNLRYVRTRLGIRDTFWCNRPEIRALVPGGIVEIGDEITSCPWYSPRPVPGEMSLRTMFSKAILIDIKSYDPGGVDDEKRGVVYL